MTLLKQMSRSSGQSGSLKGRYTFGGAGQICCTNLGAPESKAPTNTMPTIDPGSLSMSYERIDTIILWGRANGASGCIDGTGTQA